MELENQRALITGAAKRLGREMALSLARAGCDVVVHYHRSRDEALDTCAEIEALGRRALPLAADLAEAPSPIRMIDEIVATWGGLDILVNSASIFGEGTLQSTSEAEWDAHLDINLKAPFFLSQAFARQIGERRGHIVNLADWRAERPGVRYVAYHLSKAALLTLTQSLARALGPNVQVNAIALGAVLPNSPEDAVWFREVAKRLPLGHTGSPADVTHALHYLLTSDFVTGEVLHVTGGEHL